jgi:predicted outer membrane repeat protein
LNQNRKTAGSFGDFWLGGVTMLNRSIVLVLGALIILPSPAFAGTWYVDGMHGDDGNNCKTKFTACATIGHAISLAVSGDTIQIAPATYQENLSIPFNLMLNGAKPATTIINGTNTANVLTVGAGIILALSNLTIEKGVGYSGGGGVDNAGSLIVSNSNFYLNTALSGGAILNTGMATISKTSFVGNSPYFFGHSASCGAIDNRSAMTITTSTFDTNYAQNNVTAGGGVCNGGTLTITNSTFHNNSSSGNNTGLGGAIYNYAGTLNVTNSTFSANAATTSGGAIYSNGGTVQISNSTFGTNPENNGGGGALSNAGSSVRIQNSIVANNGNGGNCAGTITSDGYNLSSDSTCIFTSVGDLNNKNPKLGMLRKNGGPTQTMALQRGSPALDAGNPGGCRDLFGNLLKTDQRGMPRPGGGESTGCDMGAYESQTYMFRFIQPAKPHSSVR